MSETIDIDAGRLKLLGKLHEVATELDHMEKGGYNAHHKYSYVRATDVVRQVREGLLQRGIICVPQAANATHEILSGGSILTTVNLAYEFIDSSTRCSVTVPWVGVGIDKNGDKGVYKAMTGGLKYALMTLFLIPSTDDPEADGYTEAPAGASQPQTAPPSTGQHKDDMRPPAPQIPMDRASDILSRAIKLGEASYDLESNPGTPPAFTPTFLAVLALHGVERIGNLNADSAEAVEAWLRNEEAAAAGATV